MGKVTVDFRDAQKKFDQFKNKAKDKAVNVLKTEVRDSLLRGVSPVKGFGRFQKYSPLYLNQIKTLYFRIGKRPSPVNLKLTGKLLESLFTRVKRNGVVIGFDNFLADIHNREGAGKSKVVRRMLPTGSGESFSVSITNRLRESVAAVAREIFKK